MTETERLRKALLAYQAFNNIGNALKASLYELGESALKNEDPDRAESSVSDEGWADCMDRVENYIRRRERA